jgi:hypothetical protein
VFVRVISSDDGGDLKLKCFEFYRYLDDFLVWILSCVEKKIAFTSPMLWNRLYICGKRGLSCSYSEQQ